MIGIFNATMYHSLLRIFSTIITASSSSNSSRLSLSILKIASGDGGLSVVGAGAGVGAEGVAEPYIGAGTR